MDAAEDRRSEADSAGDDGGRLVGQIGVAGENLAGSQIADKGASSIVVGVEDAVRRLDPRGSGSSVALIGEGSSSVDGSNRFSSEKGELSLFGDFEGESSVEFDVGGGVVGSGAKADVGPSFLDKGADFSVAGSSKCGVVGAVSPSRKDEVGGGGIPVGVEEALFG